MYRDEPPRVTWLDILNLAERLQPTPSLVPTDIEDRMLMHGLLNELAGEGGMFWQGRLLMFRAMEQALDLYWACFSQPLDPLPLEVIPMPARVRSAWQGMAVALAGHGYTLKDCLLQHRDFIFREHIGLPLDF